MQLCKYIIRTNVAESSKLPLKFIYSEKATKFCEIFPLLLTVCTVVKRKGKMNIKNLTKIFISFQALFEKLGKTSRTVDTELESQIENLRDTQRKYGNVLRLARALTSHFYHVIQTQVRTYRISANSFLP